MTRKLPSDWSSRRKRIYERDNYQCQHCSRRDGMNGVTLHVHHVIPRKYGGSHDGENLLTVCERCHRELHSKFKGFRTFLNELNHREKARQSKKAVRWKLRNELQDIDSPNRPTIQKHINTIEISNRADPTDLAKALKGHIEQTPIECDSLPGESRTR